MEPGVGSRSNGLGRPAASRQPAGGAVWSIAMAGLSMVILAGVVLLPAYAELVHTDYQLRCLQAKLANAEAWTAVNERLIRDLPDDRVVIERLARSQFRWLPDNEQVMIDPKLDHSAAPRLVNVPAHPLPPRPRSAALTMATVVKNATTRNCLLLIAAAAMILSLLVFGPTRSNPGNNPGSTSAAIS